MSIKPTTIPTKQLSQNLASAGLTLYLNNTLAWDAVQLSSADFGTQAFAVLRNSANSQLELIEIDPATVTSAAAITILKRGLGYDGSQTASTETAYDWLAGDTYVELGADTPQLLALFADQFSAETIDGVKTFSSVPKTTGGNAVDATELVRKAQLDAAVLGALTTLNIVVPGLAGETVAAGNSVYLKVADGRWWKTDADDASTVQNVILGIAQGAGTAGNSISGGVLKEGVDSNQSALVANTKYYFGNTAGAFTSTTGTFEVSAGISHPTDATKLYFFPRYDQQITEDQQDALTSTTAPAAGNKYITQKDLQIGAETYAADAGGDDTYAVTLDPVPAAYVNGMVVQFKPATANTGPATLDVNGLGPIAINKLHDQALETGDIEANQIVTVIYNSTGPKFQMISQVASLPFKFTIGSATRAIDTATGVVTYAHGLAVVPRLVKITAMYTQGAGVARGESVGTYDGTNTHTAYGRGDNQASAISTTSIVFIDAAGAGQTAIITVDATNISLSWTRVGSGITGDIALMWETYS